MQDNQQMEPKKISAIKRISIKIQMTLRKILIVMAIVIMPIITLVIGGRLFDQGHLVKKGANLKVSGLCRDKDGKVRAELAQDQIIITGMTDKTIEGIIRKTREYVDCDLNKVSVDSLGPISELFSGTEVAIPPLEKNQVVEVKKTDDIKRYENKAFMISGVCKTSEGKNLPAFIDQKVEITSVQALDKEPGKFMFAGIRADKATLVCRSTDVTIKEYSQQRVDSNIAMTNSVSYIGKKMLVTGLCTPDFRIYKDTNRRPEINFYDLTNTAVEIVEEEMADGNIKAMAGIIADQNAKIGDIAIYTHRIYCDTSKYPLKIKDPADESVGVDVQKQPTGELK